MCQILDKHIFNVLYIAIYNCFGKMLHTGSILSFTISGHLPEILHFLFMIVTFPFAG